VDHIDSVKNEETSYTI